MAVRPAAGIEAAGELRVGRAQGRLDAFGRREPGLERRPGAARAPIRSARRTSTSAESSCVRARFAESASSKRRIISGVDRGARRADRRRGPRGPRGPTRPGAAARWRRRQGAAVRRSALGVRALQRCRATSRRRARPMGTTSSDEARRAEQRLDFRVVGDRDRRDRARDREDRRVQAHAEDEVASGDQRGRVARARAVPRARPSGPRARRRRRTREASAKSSSSVQGLFSKGTKSSEPRRSARRRGRAPAATSRSHASGSTPRDQGRSATPTIGAARLDAHADEDVLGPHALRGEEKGRVRRDAVTPRRGHAERLGAAPARPRRARRCARPPAATARTMRRPSGADERAESEAVQRDGLAGQRGEDRRSRVERDAAVARRQQRAGVDALVVLEEAASADDDEVDCAGPPRRSRAGRARATASTPCRCRVWPGSPERTTMRADGQPAAKARRRARRGSLRPRCCRTRSSR